MGQDSVSWYNVYLFTAHVLIIRHNQQSHVGFHYVSNFLDDGSLIQRKLPIYLMACNYVFNLQ